MALSESDAWADCLGVCRTCRADAGGPHADDCPDGLGLGVARGDQWLPGEVCSGPCGEALAAGERYALVDEMVTCLGCAAGEAA